MPILSNRKFELYKRLSNTGYIFSSFFWVLAVVGLVLLIAGFVLTYVYEEKAWGGITITLGQTCIVSVLFTIISKSSFFLDFFSDILEDIVYSSGHIKHRTDKEVIWERVTKCLFESKIPGLHDEISKTIRETYIPNSGVSYYDDYRQIIKLSWVDKEQGILKSEDFFSFDLYTNDTERFLLEREGWVPCSCNPLHNGVRLIKSYKVNGVEKVQEVKTPKDTIESKHFEGVRCYKNEIWLEGSVKYHIEQTTERTFCLNDDCFSGFRAKWLVNNMDVRLTHPEDLDVKYVTRGTSGNFNIVKNDIGCLDIEYKGLILRNQGYILLFTKK